MWGIACFFCRQVDAVQYVEYKRSCLACTRLRLADEVVWRIHHEEVECLLLDFRRATEVHVRDALEDVFIAAYCQNVLLC